jgi:hypothetical protein
MSVAQEMVLDLQAEQWQRDGWFDADGSEQYWLNSEITDRGLIVSLNVDNRDSVPVASMIWQAGDIERLLDDHEWDAVIAQTIGAGYRSVGYGRDSDRQSPR